MYVHGVVPPGSARLCCPVANNPPCVQALEDACNAARQRRVEVVICTYDKLRLHVDLLSAVPWKAAIFDEVGPGGSSPGGRYTVLGSLDGPWRATT